VGILSIHYLLLIIDQKYIKAGKVEKFRVKIYEESVVYWRDYLG